MKQMRVVRHVEHGHKLHPPRIPGFPGVVAHQRRNAAVDRLRQLGIAAAAEDRRSAGVRVEQAEILRRQRKSPLLVAQ
ncbi:MAG: hypothetical protein RMJ54_19405, partial [Roseiflexaceae bacterium]|nr:hypothetical protein [Roseiflexaceae bacterium]